MEITCLCKYNGMISICTASVWENQKAGCSFAEKASERDCCQHFGLGDSVTCDCPEAQKIALENYRNEKD